MSDMDTLIETCEKQAARISELENHLRAITADRDTLYELYSIFEELAPPAIPRKLFAKKCFDLWIKHGGGE